MRSGSRSGMVLVKVTRSVAFFTVSAYERRLAAGTGGGGRLEERGGLCGGPVVLGPPVGRRAGGKGRAEERGCALRPEGGCGCAAESAVPRDGTGVTPVAGGSLGMKAQSFRRRLGASGVSENGMVCQPRDMTCSIKRENDRATRILSRGSSQSMWDHWKRALRTRSRFSSIRPDSSRARVALG